MPIGGYRLKKYADSTEGRMMYDELVKRLRETSAFAYLGEDGRQIKQTIEQAADAIEELSRAQEQWITQERNALLKSIPRWVPVTERLPEGGTRALVMRFDFVTNTPFYDLLWFDKGEWWNRHFAGDYAVTHWMPLPEAPKEEA